MSLFLSRTLWRSGLLKASVVLLIISTTFALFLIDVDIGMQNKLFYDLILFVQSFFLHLLSLLFAYELAKNDQASKLSRIFLSTQLNRSSYERARFVAIILAVLPVGVALIALDLIIATALVAYQSFLYLLSSILCGFLVLTFSRFVTPTASALYALAVVVIGNGLDELYIYATISQNSATDLMAKALYLLFPNFSIYDRSSEVVAGAVQNSFSLFLLPNMYFLLLSSAFLTLSTWRFKQKAI